MAGPSFLLDVAVYGSGDAYVAGAGVSARLGAVRPWLLSFIRVAQGSHRQGCVRLACTE
jgi:hypothetical protein